MFYSALGTVSKWDTKKEYTLKGTRHADSCGLHLHRYIPPYVCIIRNPIPGFSVINPHKYKSEARGGKRRKGMQRINSNGQEYGSCASTLFLFF